MTALSDAELRAAREAVANSRPISPMLGAALIREVEQRRRAADQDRSVIRSLSTESLRLAVALQKMRDCANEALDPDVSPAPGNRTDRQAAPR